MTAELAAVRESYDSVAADYAELLRDALAESPHDRAVLGAGLAVHTRLLRAPLGAEKSPQAYLLARREVSAGPG